MRLKSTVLVIGILIIVQILIYGYFTAGNIEALSQGIAQLQDRNQRMVSEKNRLAAQRHEFKGIIEMIPPALLAGFEDPEAGFVEFLDFLQSPVLDEVGGKVKARTRKFTKDPIPLHKSNFTFSYNFRDTYEAEKFINFVIFQERFPLQIRGFSAKRGTEGVVGGELSVDLLIPARLQLTLPSPPEK